MAYAFVQAVEGTRVTSGTTITAALTPTAGHLLVAVIGRSNASQPNSIGQVTDNVGGYWKQAAELQNFVPQGCDVWYCESAVGGSTTVTATLLAFPVTVITGMNMQVLEYSGNTGRELMDQIGTLGITTTTVTVTTFNNLAASGDLALSVVTGNMTAATVPSGWTSRLADTTQKFWVAELVGPSSGSPGSAAWTGLTSATQGSAVIVCFRATGTGTAAAGPTLLQSSYTNAAYPIASPTTSWTSQAFPVNPTAGNTLVFLCSGIVSSPFQSVPALTCTASNASDKWIRIQDSGRDNTSGVNLCIWICPQTLGGSSYTVTITFPFQSAGFSSLLMEFKGLNLLPAVVDQAGASNNTLGVSIPWQISTAANVKAGSFALSAMATLFQVPNPFTNGWTQVLSDTTGSNWAAYQLSTAAGALTNHWTGQASFAATDLVIAAIRPSPGFY